VSSDVLHLTRARRTTRAVDRTPGFHPEIQALRALAVSLVVVYHVEPRLIPNGFVGVDVFFVISGFLITGHITRSLLQHGRFRLADFYLRRVRRLLPAALLVLAVVAVATFLVVPQTQWIETARQLVASVFYVENWALAANAVDYSAPTASASPIQHFWSLSVEEQFYVFWPALLLAVAVLAKGRRRAALIVAIGVLGVASFVFSVLWTAHDSSSAYFITPTRVWEFAAGGLAAMLLPRLSMPDWARTVLSWSGLAVIAAAALRFSDANTFPGWIAAIPVVGTLAVIAAGESLGRASTAPLFRARPVQYLGDISYSVYLWHWPLVVIVPEALGTKLGWTLKVGVVIASVLLAMVTKRFVEDRFRSDQFRARQTSKPLGGRVRAARVALGALVAMGVVAALAAPMSLTATASEASAHRQLATALSAPASDLGAGAASRGVLLQTTVQNVVPAPIIAGDDYLASSHGTVCQQRGDYTGLTSCSFGSDAPGALQVAIAGDSHASQWLAGVVRIADEQGWHLTTYLRSGCPLSSEVPVGTEVQRAACGAWQADALRRLTEKRYDVVLVSSLAQTAYPSGSGVRGLEGAWARLRAAGSRIVAIRDDPTPQVAGLADVPSCVARHAGDLSACAAPRATALLVDPQIAATGATRGAELVDLSRYFCSSTTCPAVIGNVLVYRDGHHLTGTYVDTLVPALAPALLRAARG
jgi:peptidoglycan/LPS O-acetylase OafA/YrhL